MIVRSLEDLKEMGQDIEGGNWRSRRFLLKKDNMRYSLNDTIIRAGTETHIWYKNHLEAVYCIEGEGEVETIDDGKVYSIKAGTMYALNKHDNHYLRAKTDMRMVCVFSPPLTGRETHDEEGVYPLIEEDE
ncbi:L-ectoine synthase [Alkalihalophilus pseudofirmus]|nr:L-ectoine synthase [Alkalihalophilus pseudofirmus]